MSDWLSKKAHVPWPECAGNKGASEDGSNVDGQGKRKAECASQVCPTCKVALLAVMHCPFDGFAGDCCHVAPMPATLQTS